MRREQGFGRHTRGLRRAGWRVYVVGSAGACAAGLLACSTLQPREPSVAGGQLARNERPPALAEGETRAPAAAASLSEMPDAGVGGPSDAGVVDATLPNVPPKPSLPPPPPKPGPKPIPKQPPIPPQPAPGHPKAPRSSAVLRSK